MSFENQESQTNKLSGYPYFVERFLTAIGNTVSQINSSQIQTTGIDADIFLQNTENLAAKDTNILIDQLSKLVAVYRHYHFTEHMEDIIAEINLKSWTDNLLLGKPSNSLNSSQKAQIFLSKVIDNLDEFTAALSTLEGLISMPEFLQVSTENLDCATGNTKYIVNKNVLDERKAPNEKLLPIISELIGISKLDFGTSPAGELMTYLLRLCIPLIERKRERLTQDIHAKANLSAEHSSKVAFAPENEHIYNNLVIILNRLLVDNTPQMVEVCLNKLMENIKQNPSNNILYKLSRELKRYNINLDYDLIEKLIPEITQQNYFPIAQDQSPQAINNNPPTGSVLAQIPTISTTTPIAKDPSAASVSTANTLTNNHPKQKTQHNLADLAKVSMENMNILRQVVGSFIQRIDELYEEEDIVSLLNELKEQIIIKGELISKSDRWQKKSQQDLDITQAITGLDNIFKTIKPQIKEHLAHKRLLWSGLKSISKNKGQISVDTHLQTMSNQYDMLTKWRSLKADWSFFSIRARKEDLEEPYFNGWPTSPGNTGTFIEHMESLIAKQSTAAKFLEFNTWTALRYIILENQELYNVLVTKSGSNKLPDSVQKVINTKADLTSVIVQAWENETRKVGLEVISQNQDGVKIQPKVFFSPQTNAKIICEKLVPNFLEQEVISEDKIQDAIAGQSRYGKYCAENPHLDPQEVLQIITKEVIYQLETNGYMSMAGKTWGRKTLEDLKRESLRGRKDVRERNEVNYAEVNSQMTLELRSLAASLRSKLSQVVLQIPRTYYSVWRYQRDVQDLYGKEFFKLIEKISIEPIHTILNNENIQAPKNQQKSSTQQSLELTKEGLTSDIADMLQTLNEFGSKISLLLSKNYGTFERAVKKNLLHDPEKETLFSSNESLEYIKSDSWIEVFQDLQKLFFSRIITINDKGEITKGSETWNMNTHISNSVGFAVLKLAKKIHLAHIPEHKQYTFFRAKKILTAIADNTHVLRYLKIEPGQVLSTEDNQIKNFVINISQKLHGLGLYSKKDLDAKTELITKAIQKPIVWALINIYALYKDPKINTFLVQELTISVLQEIYNGGEYSQLIWDKPVMLSKTLESYSTAVIQNEDLSSKISHAYDSLVWHHNPHQMLVEIITDLNRLTNMIPIGNLQEDFEDVDGQDKKTRNQFAVALENLQVESPFKHVVELFLKEDMQSVLGTLSPRERDVLRLRYGLVGGEEKTLEEIGEIFKVTSQRIRQIEAKALRKLRHPNRNGILKEYIR